jgi:hypothetical protein
MIHLQQPASSDLLPLARPYLLKFLQSLKNSANCWGTSSQTHKLWGNISHSYDDRIHNKLFSYLFSPTPQYKFFPLDGIGSPNTLPSLGH